MEHRFLWMVILVVVGFPLGLCFGCICHYMKRVLRFQSELDDIDIDYLSGLSSLGLDLERGNEINIQQAATSGGETDVIIKSLPVFKLSSLNLSGDQDYSAVCAVCLAEFEDVDELHLLPKCRHAFHAPCIDQWLHNQCRCPICRQEVKAEDLSLFFISHMEGNDNLQIDENDGGRSINVGENVKEDNDEDGRNTACLDTESPTRIDDWNDNNGNGTQIVECHEGVSFNDGRNETEEDDKFDGPCSSISLNQE